MTLSFGSVTTLVLCSCTGNQKPSIIQTRNKNNKKPKSHGQHLQSDLLGLAWKSKVKTGAWWSLRMEHWGIYLLWVLDFLSCLTLWWKMKCDVQRSVHHWALYYEGWNIREGSVATNNLFINTRKSLLHFKQPYCVLTSVNVSFNWCCWMVSEGAFKFNTLQESYNITQGKNNLETS